MLGVVSNDPVGGYVIIALLVAFWGGGIIWGRRAGTICSLRVDNGVVVVDLLGPARLLSLRKEVRFSLDSVVVASSTPNVFSRGGAFSRKIGPLFIPTFFRVGSFRGKRGTGPTFWACFRGENAITFQLEGEHYRYLVADVADPLETLAMLSSYGVRTA